MQEVEAICGRAIIVNRGNIVADRVTSELRNGVQNGNYELLVELSGSISKSRLTSIVGVANVQEQGKNTWLIATSTSEDIRKSVSDAVTSEGLTVLMLTRKEQKWEEIFKQLTGTKSK